VQSGGVTRGYPSAKTLTLVRWKSREFGTNYGSDKVFPNLCRCVGDSGMARNPHLVLRQSLTNTIMVTRTFAFVCQNDALAR
jgi:hypothetical protein